MTEHERAVQAARRTTQALDEIFAQVLGSAAHPRGMILSAYRRARLALAGNTKRPEVVTAVMSTLAQELRGAAAEGLQRAIVAGQTQAAVELAIYGLPVWGVAAPAALIANALSALQAIIREQQAALGYFNEGVLLGDANRIGLFAPGAAMQGMGSWLTQASLLAYMGELDVSLGQRRGEFGHQAIAAIDERTTDCCLRVNGQWQPLAKPFKLTGTPRFADELDHPPFHLFCRSATALVLQSDADDFLSVSMRAAGLDELAARARTGTRVEIHPADSTSRR